MGFSGTAKVSGPARSEREFCALVETAPDAMTLIRRDGTIIQVNGQLANLFGYGRRELLGKKVEVLIPKRFRRRHVKRRTEYFRSPGVRPMGSDLKVYGVRKNGVEFPVEIGLSPVEIDGVTHALVVIHDITSRKQLEKALRESEERFRLALQNSPVVVFHQDRMLRYTWINSAVLRWADETYLGRTDTELIGGEEGTKLTTIKETVVRTGVGSRSEVTVTYMGETHYFDLTVEPLRGRAGEILGITGVAVDKTPLKKSELERERLIAELQDALEEVKLLSGLISICASCKRIKDEHEHWQPLESYIQSHSEAKFTHGMCQDCLKRLYPQYYSK